MKMRVFTIFTYKQLFVTTMVQFSTEVNHLIRKELYQKQNGLSLFRKFCLHYRKIDFCCEGNTSFVHTT